MPRRKPATKDANGPSDKRGGYTGGADAATVPPPQRVPSAYLLVTEEKNPDR